MLAFNASDASKDVVPCYDIFEGIESYLYPTGGARAGVFGFISAFWPRTCDRKEQGSWKHGELLQGIRGRWFSLTRWFLHICKAGDVILGFSSIEKRHFLALNTSCNQKVLLGFEENLRHQEAPPRFYYVKPIGCGVRAVDSVPCHPFNHAWKNGANIRRCWIICALWVKWRRCISHRWWIPNWASQLG